MVHASMGAAADARDGVYRPDALDPLRPASSSAKRKKPDVQTGPTDVDASPTGIWLKSTYSAQTSRTAVDLRRR